MNNNELFDKILFDFHKNNITNDIILLGSWCLHLYKEHYKSNEIPVFRTSDIDLMVPYPSKIHNNVDIPELLKNYNFKPIYSLNKNYVKFDNPDLRVEFLTPEYGKGSDKPHEIPNYKINAQGLRYISIAIDFNKEIKYKEIPIKVPEPSCFLLIKLLTIPKRQNKEKQDKDIRTVDYLSKFILNNTDHKNMLIKIYSKLNKNWQKTILNTAKEHSLENIYIELEKVRNKSKGIRRYPQRAD